MSSPSSDPIRKEVLVHLRNRSPLFAMQFARNLTGTASFSTLPAAYLKWAAEAVLAASSDSIAMIDVNAAAALEELKNEVHRILFYGFKISLGAPLVPDATANMNLGHDNEIRASLMYATESSQAVGAPLGLSEKVGVFISDDLVPPALHRELVSHLDAFKAQIDPPDLHPGSHGKIIFILGESALNDASKVLAWRQSTGMKFLRERKGETGDKTADEDCEDEDEEADEDVEDEESNWTRDYPSSVPKTNMAGKTAGIGTVRILYFPNWIQHKVGKLYVVVLQSRMADLWKLDHKLVSVLKAVLLPFYMIFFLASNAHRVSQCGSAAEPLCPNSFTIDLRYLDCAHSLCFFIVQDAEDKPHFDSHSAIDCDANSDGNKSDAEGGNTGDAEDGNTSDAEVSSSESFATEDGDEAGFDPDFVADDPDPEDTLEEENDERDNDPAESDAIQTTTSTITGYTF
ncbi:hypothetical protein B0H19DRAFT_1234491 [Mycena capillaripes]|nr:hypothetical protein B0H19DRAFT_1234491 [Mycena capillaripes]